jgi:cyclopropane fatty-acyl-phospholipid synthase-like methyltransferase
MQTFLKIDWNQAWRDDCKARSQGDNREFWNRRAPSFAKHRQEDGADDYVESFLRVMQPQPDWSVLDVGCGPGTLAIPLAKTVRRVTGLDFSSAMIEILRNRKTSLEFARRRVFVSYAVGNGPFDPRIIEAVGRKPRSSPDYIYLYNLLHQMGIYANVEMIEQKTRAFTDEEEAVNSLRFMVDNATPAEEEALRRFVSAHLVPAGKLWILDGKRSVEWAMIWWKMEQRP